MTQYEFDRESFSFRKVTTSIGSNLWRVLKWLVASFSLVALYYIVISLFLSTDKERALIRENKAYEKQYEQMLSRQQLLADEIEGLRQRDDAIYEEIFHSPAPEVDPVSSAGLGGASAESGASEDVGYTEGKAAVLEAKAARIEENFRQIFALANESGRIALPMHVPIDNMTYAQTGAGTGSRISPFYKVAVGHDGLDLIAGQGEAVRAAGNGTVKEVIMSGKGLGNIVVIDHGNGYLTRYCHLGDILVSQGQKVTYGKKIASIGISGSSFAPHLHYEVLHDGVPVDPTAYLFASVTPAEYANIAYMASQTLQSLD